MAKVTPPGYFYVVVGRTGEYSDSMEWPVVGYLDQEEAKTHADRANEIAKILKAARENYTDEELAELNPYDPGMKMDYTGTHYVVKKVPMGYEAPDHGNPFKEEKLCLACAQMIEVKDGRLVKHDLAKASGSGSYGECEGSGRHPDRSDQKPGRHIVEDEEEDEEDAVPITIPTKPTKYARLRTALKQRADPITEAEIENMIDARREARRRQKVREVMKRMGFDEDEILETLKLNTGKTDELLEKLQAPLGMTGDDDIDQALSFKGKSNPKRRKKP